VAEPVDPRRITITAAPAAMNFERFDALTGRAGNIPVGEVAPLGVTAASSSANISRAVCGLSAGYFSRIPV
jgi:hypothetical protein